VVRGERLVELGLRLLGSGMAAPGRRASEFGLKMFAVHKSSGRQRLVFDCRRANLYFEAPPPCEMGSLEGLGSLDLSSGAVGQARACAYAGDVPDFFYALSVQERADGCPAGVSEYFWLEGLTGQWYESLRERALAAGYGTASEWDSGDSLCLTVLPMGWSWAPVFAQWTLEEKMEEALGAPGEGPPLVYHGRPPPLVKASGDARGARLVYLDDFSGLALGPTEEAAADQAGAHLARARDALVAAGLGCHKEQLGPVLTVLGAELQADARRLVPDRAKFRELLAGTQGLLRCGRASSACLERVVGKWTALLLLRREMFGCLRWVYLWMRAERDAGSHAERKDLPQRVLGELRMLLHLAPMLTAELSWEVCPARGKHGGWRAHRVRSRDSQASNRVGAGGVPAGARQRVVEDGGRGPRIA